MLMVSWLFCIPHFHSQKQQARFPKARSQTLLQMRGPRLFSIHRAPNDFNVVVRGRISSNSVKAIAGACAIREAITFAKNANRTSKLRHQIGALH